LLWILNNIVVFSSAIFIFDSISIKVENCRLSVFALIEEAEGFTVLAHVLQREASTFPSWIIYSDSEYELLLPIHITDSYMLNVAAEEALVLQNSIWVGKGGVTG